MKLHRDLVRRCLREAHGAGVGEGSGLSGWCRIISEVVVVGGLVEVLELFEPGRKCFLNAFDGLSNYRIFAETYSNCL